MRSYYYDYFGNIYYLQTLQSVERFHIKMLSYFIFYFTYIKI